MEPEIERVDAEVVAQEMRGFSDELQQIIERVCSKSYVTRAEKEDLQLMLKVLKPRLKEAAKRVARNGAERCYFAPAVMRASAGLLIATNSHPIASRWCSALMSTQMEFSHYLHNLYEAFPDLRPQK